MPCAEATTLQPPQSLNELALLSARLIGWVCSLFGPRSLVNNNIRAQGAQHIGEALKINKALTDLKCSPTSHPRAILGKTILVTGAPSTSARALRSTRHSPSSSARRFSTIPIQNALDLLSAGADST
eukprot:scaffold24379_cov122-Isochrysis_galbana.AAC.2